MSNVEAGNLNGPMGLSGGFMFLTKIRALMATMVLACVLTTAAHADMVRNVTVTEGPGWVKVNVHGNFNYSVKHLPPGTDDYRSIAIDVYPAYINPRLEPKIKLPVDEGLVGQVRVRQLTGSTVRVYVDVIAWPKYDVMRVPGSVEVGIDAYHMRPEEPSASR